MSTSDKDDGTRRRRQRMRRKLLSTEDWNVSDVPPRYLCVSTRNGDTYILCDDLPKLMWQVKHLNGFTLVSTQASANGQRNAIDCRSCPAQRSRLPRQRTSQYMAFEMFVSGKGLATVRAEHHFGALGSRSDGGRVGDERVSMRSNRGRTNGQRWSNEKPQQG